MVARTARRLLAVGSYTPGNAAGGDGPPGLTTWWWDGRTGIRPAGSADLPSPTFACWHPTLPVLYATSEVDDGFVTTFAVADDGSLQHVATTATGGAQPCWVTTDPAGSALLIANYASGSMALIALDGAGRPVGGPVVVAHRGSGPVPGRQEGPHVHQVVPTADGHVLASDLGIDRIVEYRIEPATAGGQLSVTEAGVIEMPAGSGCRHITLAAGGRTGFVSGELDGSVTVIRRAAGPSGAPGGGGRWVAAEHVPSSTRSGAGPAVQPSQILLAGGDRWLLVANRGPDTLAVLDVTDRLTVRHEVQVGRQPRHFVVEGDTVLLACQGQDVVQVLAPQESTGSLSAAGALTPEAGGDSPFVTPACVAVRH